MKTYSERLNRITHEFIMFAGFAALEGRFRALNNNYGTDDDIDSVSYGFATSGMAVCGLRLLYQLGGLSYAAYTDCKNYIRGSHNVIQPDPFDQLEANVQEVRSVHQLKIDHIKELEEELEAEKKASRVLETRLTARIDELEKDNKTLRVSQTLRQNSGLIQNIK